MKKLIGIFCLCIILTLTTGFTANAADNTTATEAAEEQKKQLLSVPIGNEVGQVAYNHDYQYGFIGPEAFAVENDTILILDTNNRRVVIWKDGEYSSISISDCPYAQHMTYDNGMIGVVDTARNVTGIYAQDGTQIALIPHPQSFVSKFPRGISEIGEDYVVWITTDGSHYKYNWETEEMSRLVKGGAKSAFVGKTTVVTDMRTGMEWVFDFKPYIGVLKVSGDNLFYSRFDAVRNVSHFAGTLSVGILNQYGEGDLFAVDQSMWYTNPTNPFYVSEDGRVYQMDCYEDEVVISELLLKKPGTSVKTNPGVGWIRKEHCVWL